MGFADAPSHGYTPLYDAYKRLPNFRRLNTMHEIDILRLGYIPVYNASVKGHRYWIAWVSGCVSLRTNSVSVYKRNRLY